MFHTTRSYLNSKIPCCLYVRVYVNYFNVLYEMYSMFNDEIQRNSCLIFRYFNQNSLTRGNISSPKVSEFKSLITLTDAVSIIKYGVTKSHYKCFGCLLRRTQYIHKLSFFFSKIYKIKNFT